MVKQEEKIDDLAALFLPDLLTPIGNYNVNPNSKTDENGFLFGIEQTTDQVSQQYPQLNSHPYGIDTNFRSSLGDLTQMGMRSFNNTTMDLGHNLFYQHDAQPVSTMSYTSQDSGNTTKETANVSTLMPPPLRQRPNILPIQSYGQMLGQSYANVGGQSFGQILNQSFNNYDNILWLLQSESLQMQRPVNGQMENSNHNTQMHMFANSQPQHPVDLLLEDPNANARRKKALAPAIPDIQIDYSPNSLLHLLDMTPINEGKKVEICNSFGESVSVEVKGFLHGRFCTNNLDNYIYRLGLSGSIDESRLYSPAVISCYRRNFINIHLAVTVNSNDKMTINGELIKQFRLQIGATAQGPEAGVATFSVRDNEHDPKDPTRAGDNLAVDTIGERHILADLKSENYFMVRKLKFDNSTVNTLKLSSQTYYCLTVTLIAEIPSGSVEIETLISTPIIVRGRNPSFYNTRNDILIKPRSPYFRASYGSSESLPSLPALKENIYDAPPSASDENLVDNSNDPFLSIKTDDLSDENENVSGSEEESPLDEMDRNSDDLYIKQILDNMLSNSDSNYHYFPVLNVYYTPPVNVVYFPHGAHLSSTVAQASESSQELNSSKEGTSARKKVYFK